MPRPLPPPWYRLFGMESTARGPYIFSCEHASNYFGPSEISQTTRALLDQHWAFDLGAAALTEALASRTASLGVLSTYSRLLLDPNRELTSTSLVGKEVEGTPIECNQNLDEEERQYRIACLHKGYHDALDMTLRRALSDRRVGLVSIHSFTPVWAGMRRDVEVGVLFDEREELATALVNTIEEFGYRCRPNEPYSGLTGELMYAATRHGHTHQIPYIEFEVRQDLLSSQDGVNKISEVLQRALDRHLKPLIDSALTN